MKNRLLMGWMVVALMLLPVLMKAEPALAKPVVVPLKGQTEVQRTNDIVQAEAWAAKETGVNPADVKYRLEWLLPPVGGAGDTRRVGYDSSVGRSVVYGAARGAAYGAIADAVDNPVAAGAIIGGSESALRHRYHDRRVQPKPSPTGTSVAADRAKLHADHQRYLRAFKAYIEPKGYRVTF